MKSLTCLGLIVFLSLTATDAFSAHPLGGMRLLEGYKHRALQGIDSTVGQVEKKGGMTIHYEIGRITPPGAPATGGSFSDNAKMTPRKLLRWYREQTVNGQPVHIAYRNDNVLLVSFPRKGMNMNVRVRSIDEMADALTMILTYPGPEVKDRSPDDEISDDVRAEPPVLKEP